MFRGRVPSPIQRVLARCDEMSLANTGSLYLEVPLRCFARLKDDNFYQTLSANGENYKRTESARHRKLWQHIGIRNFQSKRIAPIHDECKH